MAINPLADGGECGEQILVFRCPNLRNGVPTGAHDLFIGLAHPQHSFKKPHALQLILRAHPHYPAGFALHAFLALVADLVEPQNIFRKQEILDLTDIVKVFVGEPDALQRVRRQRRQHLIPTLIRSEDNLTYFLVKAHALPTVTKFLELETLLEGVLVAHGADERLVPGHALGEVPWRTRAGGWRLRVHSISRQGQTHGQQARQC